MPASAHLFPVQGAICAMILSRRRPNGLSKKSKANFSSFFILQNVYKYKLTAAWRPGEVLIQVYLVLFYFVSSHFILHPNLKKG